MRERYLPKGVESQFDGLCGYQGGDDGECGNQEIGLALLTEEKRPFLGISLLGPPKRICMGRNCRLMQEKCPGYFRRSG